jgi:hypothetical protein
MRFVHSLWSEPSLDDRWGIDGKEAIITNMWYYALSVAYLKRLGQEVVLHTDNFGKLCLDHVPYDHIYLTLEEQIPKGICPVMWACGKFYALREEPLGSVHIDGDVFIKSKECLDIINTNDYDLFCQEIEYDAISGSPDTIDLYEKTNEIISHLKYPEEIARTGYRAYNTGVLCFNNKKLKERFLEVYFDINKQVINDTSIIDKWEVDKEIIIDLATEQRFIYDLSNGYNVKCLINYYKDVLHTTAKDIGFQHVLSKNKYFCLEKCKAALKYINEELYHLTEEKERYLKEKYFSN